MSSSRDGAAPSAAPIAVLAAPVSSSKRAEGVLYRCLADSMTSSFARRAAYRILLSSTQSTVSVDTDMVLQFLFHDDSDGNAITEQLRNIMRSPEVAAGLLLDIISGSTREKDGGEFHSVCTTAHPSPHPLQAPAHLVEQHAHGSTAGSGENPMLVNCRTRRTPDQQQPHDMRGETTPRGRGDPSERRRFCGGVDHRLSRDAHAQQGKVLERARFGAEQMPIVRNMLRAVRVCGAPYEPARVHRGAGGVATR
ncbi:hypothetical protein BJ912DRAFT_1095799 [Pholiota molesta]|nr:hypothetical protein BJ912DRAFT_1095799 [Pholiota molesta]